MKRSGAGYRAPCAAALTTFMLLAACGGGDGDSPQRDQTASTARPATPAAIQPWFLDVTAQSGLPAGVQPGYGMAWSDFDRDGWLDAWGTNHMYKPSLFRNNRDGTFADIIDQVWHSDPEFDSHGGAWADFDNDGDQDLVELAGTKKGTVCLDKPFYVNEGGQLVNRAGEYGLNDRCGRGRTPLWLDWNRDGRLDVFVVNGKRPVAPAAPSVVMVQGADHHFAPLAGLAVEEDSLMAQLVHFNGSPHVLLSNEAKTFEGMAFPSAFFRVGDVQPVPMLVDDKPASSVVLGKVRDVVVGDFDNDGRHDLLILQTGDREPAYAISDQRRRLVVRVTDLSKEQGIDIAIEGSGKLRLRLFDAFWRSTVIRLGAQGAASDAVRVEGSLDGMAVPWTEIELDPARADMQGILPPEQRTSRGVYIGRTEANHWLIVARGVADDELGALVESTGSTRIGSVQPIGFSWVKNTSRPPLLLLQRAGQFKQRAAAWGLPAKLSCQSGVAGDFDNDMDQDVYFACSTPLGNLDNRLFENTGSAFVEVPLAGGGATPNVRTGGRVSMADFDHDGYLDLLVTDGCAICGAPSRLGLRTLLRNQRSGNHWIQFDLVGCTSNRDAIGARVLVTAGGKRQMRMVDGGMHDGTQNQARLHFGLAQNAAVESVKVEWPSGKVAWYYGVLVDSVNTLREDARCARAS